MTEIPLFPLSSVLLPYGRMPLQIFEQRYLDLIRSCMHEGTGFGVVWIRRGSEVATKGSARPDLGDYGTYARIVDWDQLDNGLLGIVVEGGETFDLLSATRATTNLVIGEVEMHPVLEPVALPAIADSLAAVLRSLETHPHVQRMNLDIDYNNAWKVAYTLIQLLPLDEALKYELLGANTLDELLGELDILLNQISGDE